MLRVQKSISELFCYYLSTRFIERSLQNTTVKCSTVQFILSMDGTNGKNAVECMQKGMNEYFAFVLFALLSDRRGVVATDGGPVQRHGNAHTRDADENHRHQVDDNEQQQEEAAPKMTTQVVESVGADLA